MAASLLYDQQVRRGPDDDATAAAGGYGFAVLLAGRGPLVSLSRYSAGPALVSAGRMSLEDFEYPEVSPCVLRLPTIHVHGLEDEGLGWHRKMMEVYHDPKTRTVVEWEGGHRVPLKRSDVIKVTAEIYRVAREQGINV